MSNYIGIDISLNSTAVFIRNKKGDFILSFTNKKDNNIYIKELSQCGVKFLKQERPKDENYSKNEILKLKSFISTSDEIVQKIIEHIDLTEKSFCNIEGYSFSKNTQSILDIVSLSTLVRYGLITKIKDIDIEITSPSTLKLETCKLVYPPIDLGIKKPKLKWVNNEGIPGGSFKKPQMFKAMLDGDIKSPILQFLKDYRFLSERDKIPNPIEDIIDAIFAGIILENKFNI